MGIKSTYDIGRETAIEVIINKIHSCTNDQLSNMLEEFEESYFRNYAIYDEIPEDASSYRTIKTYQDFINCI